MPYYIIDVWQDESIWSWAGEAEDYDDAQEQARLTLNDDWEREYETWDELAEDMDGTALLHDENAGQRANVAAYDAELNRLEIPPNGDDYNAILALLDGSKLVLPTTEGR